jgi:signal transduction histidine kinase
MSKDITALQTQLDEAERRAEGLRRVIELISGELALEPLLTRIVESAVELIGAQYGSIGLVRERSDGPVVQIAAVMNMPAQELGAEFPAGMGLAGRVLRDQSPLHLERYGDLQQPALPEFAEHMVIGMPIWWSQRMIGFFGIGAEAPRRFDDQDVETLGLFARHAAVAIENARLFAAEQRRSARIAVINQIGRLFAGSLDFGGLFQTAVEAIRENFGFAYLAAGIVDPDDPEMLVLLAHTGLHVDKVPAGYRQSIHEGVVGRAARTRQRVLINNIHREPYYLSVLQASSICAELATPIIVGGRLLGVINIESERPIAEEEAESISIIADQFGAALENARLFNSTQRALESAQHLYATSRRISTAMTVDDVVAAYLEQVAAHGLYTCTIVLNERDELGQRATATIRGRWTPVLGVQILTERQPFIHSGLTPLLDAGQLVTVADVASDARLGGEVRTSLLANDRAAAALIPLMVGIQRIGLVILGRPIARPWDTEDLTLYQTTAAQLALAIESRRQHRLLSERSSQLAVLEERRRLARELHDSVTQSLFSMSLLSQVIPDLWEIDREEARQALAQIRDLTRGALGEMRALLFELRPAEGEQNLAQLLRRHIATFEQRNGIAVTFETQGGEVALPGEVAQALFRIAQEALTNVARHAHAQHISVTLHSGRPARLIISDDGRGFQPDAVGEGRFGLVSMRERAANIKALLGIRSAIGQGTEITVEWPLLAVN